MPLSVFEQAVFFVELFPRFIASLTTARRFFNKFASIPYVMKRMLSRILLIFFLASTFAVPSLAQETGVTFTIQDQEGKPVPFATITATSVSDPGVVARTSADSLGIAFMKLMVGKTYLVNASSAAFQPVEKEIHVVAAKNEVLLTLQLAPTLSGVTVTSSRPLMRQEDDKTIIDPANLVASSTSGYEVIEKTPGLFMDQDGNIYIHSTTPATILINGREMKMSTADIASLLKSLPPNSIASIEIVRTPSARYDASGSGGVVNVILRKGVRLGLTGSVNGGMQQGLYGNQFAGFNLNNNNGAVTTYLNVNFSRRNSMERISTKRILGADTILEQDAFTRYPSNVLYGGFGIAYDVSPKWSVSYDGRVNYTSFHNRTDNASLIQKTGTGEVFTENINRLGNKGHTLVMNHGMNAKLKIDTLGSEWSTDVSYTMALTPSSQAYGTAFSFPSLPDYEGDGDIDARRHFIAAQSDLVYKLPARITLEGGEKTSFLDFRNATEYFRQSGGTRDKDPSRTSSFHYRENINAAYLQASKTFFRNVILKSGVRMENTVMKGRQLVPGDTTFNINRTDFFPYVYLSKKVITIAGFELRAYLVYRRTIVRPVYEQLNPFPRFIDQYLSEVGNPALRPQFNHNYEANISVNEMPILAIGINQTKDIFTNVIYRADSNYVLAYRTYDNLGRNKEFYLRGLGAIPPGGKYFFVLGGQYNHNFYEGRYEDQPLSFRKGSWTFFTYHTLKVGQRTNFTLSGFIRLKGQLQFYELSTFGALNASVNHSFLNRKLTVTLSGSDIFGTNRNEFIINQGSVHASGFREGDTQRFGLNLRYNFGIRKKEEKADFLNVDIPK